MELPLSFELVNTILVFLGFFGVFLWVFFGGGPIYSNHLLHTISYSDRIRTKNKNISISHKYKLNDIEEQSQIL